MQHIVTFDGDTTQRFIANYRRADDYKASIQNLSGQQITITVSNVAENRNQGTPTYSTPAQGAVVIATGDAAVINEPYVEWLLTAGAPATGNVYIVEAG